MTVAMLDSVRASSGRWYFDIRLLSFAREGHRIRALLLVKIPTWNGSAFYPQITVGALWLPPLSLRVGKGETL